MREENLILLNTSINAQNLNEKIRISPIGEVEGIDGRTFSIGKNVSENTKSMGIDLVLDRNHWGEEALGWFSYESLEQREDGIYASLELTPEGKTLVENRSYRYLSPVYEISNQNIKEVIKIIGVGLVNQPNLLKDALNSQGETTVNNEENLKAQIEELKKKNEELTKQIEDLKAQAKKNEDDAVNKKVENAIKVGEMLPSRKENAFALRGVALNNFLEVCKSEAKMTLQDKEFNAQKPKGDEIDASIKEQLGLED